MAGIDPTKKNVRAVTGGGSLDRRLAVYALAGSAALGAGAPATGATVDCFPGITIGSIGGPNACELDLNNDGIVDYTIHAAVGTFGQFFDIPDTELTGIVGVEPGPEGALNPNGNGFWGLKNPSTPPSLRAEYFKAFALPGKPSMRFSDAKGPQLFPKTPGFLAVNPEDSVPGSVAWKSGNPKALPVVFHDENLDHYWGAVWLSTQFDPSEGGVDVDVTVHGWDYAAKGEEFHIVPEPSTLSMFALGAVGILAYRRRKQKSQSLDS